MDATALIIWIGAGAGAFVGSYLPSLFGIGMFSITCVITSTIGGLIGVYFGYKISQYL